MAASYRSSTYGARSSRTGRLTAALLAAAIVALLLFALLRLGGFQRQMFGDGRPLSTFDLAPSADEGRASTPKRQEREVRQATRERPTPVVPRPVEPRPPVPDPILHLPGVMILSRADYAAADLSKLRGTAPAATGAGDAAGSGAGEADTVSIGLGPGGQKLYPAEWYREPRRAETQPYLQAVKQPGYGIVACRTIERYHVEDCQELEETPGSGIARAVRQAAWQFLVRPPRINGKPQIGTWVRIKFDIASPGKSDD